MKNTMLVTGLLVASLTVSAAAAGHENKKLIPHGWGPPTPGYVAKHIRQMETRPFDGVAMILDRRSFNHVFFSRELDDEQTQAYLDDLAAIQWEKFTDNFLMMYCRSNMDWFSEEGWRPVYAKIQALETFHRLKLDGRIARIMEDLFQEPVFVLPNTIRPLSALGYRPPSP